MAVVGLRLLCLRWHLLRPGSPLRASAEDGCATKTTSRFHRGRGADRVASLSYRILGVRLRVMSLGTTPTRTISRCANMRSKNGSPGAQCAWERCCKLVHNWAEHLAHAPPGHPVAEVMRWRCPLWWSTCQAIGDATGGWLHAHPKRHGGLEDSAAIILGPDRPTPAQDGVRWKATSASLQRRCAGLSLGVRPWPLEDLVQFRRRHGRIAAVALCATMQWSKRFLEASVARLAAYRMENSERCSWPGSVCGTGMAAEFAVRRVMAGSGSTRAGRISTRIVSGRVAPRSKETVLESAALAGVPT